MDDRDARVSRPTSTPSLIYFAVVVLTATSIGIAATWWGIAVGPDSASYLDLYGRGPGAGGYGPMYTWLFSSVCGDCDVYEKARFMGVLVWVAGAAVTYLIVLRSTQHALTSLVAAGFFMFSGSNLSVQSAAGSEGLFALFLLIALWLVAAYLDVPSRWRAVAAGLATAALTLTRFAGVPMFGVGVLGIAIFGRGSFRQRIVDAALFLFAGGAPIVFWMRPWAEGVSATGYHIALLGNPDAAIFINGLRGLVSLAIPSSLPLPIIVGVVVLGSVLVSLAVLKHQQLVSRSTLPRRPLAFLPLICFVFIASYLALILLSVFIVANQPLLPRYMVPVLIALIPLLATTAHSLVVAKPGVRLQTKRAVAVVSILLLSGNAVRAGVIVWKSYDEGGGGMRSRQWLQSETIDAIRNLPRTYNVYSNGDVAVLFLTGRIIDTLPLKFMYREGPTPEFDEHYRRRMAKLRRDLVENGAYVVYFDRMDWRFDVPAESELVPEYDLVAVADLSDGRIYRSRAWLATH